MTKPIRMFTSRRFTARLIVFVSFAALYPAAWAQMAPPLGDAQRFAVLGGGQTVTNAGSMQPTIFLTP